jgi:prephenate dehydratase
MKIAFQGTHGAYSEEAIVQTFGQNVATLPCEHFTDVIAAVENGDATHAMLPVENATAGTVIGAYDALLNCELHIQQEVILPIHHCLMVNPGVALENITAVRSHTQALSQCEFTLKALGITPVAHYDTAGAAKALAKKPEPHTAAIASALAATLYGLAVIKPNCEDEDFNQTRFFVLAKNESTTKSGNTKTSLIFALQDKPNQLATVLNLFASAGINLCKIESRPSRDKAWDYIFFLDFYGNTADEHVQAVLTELETLTRFVKNVGTYIHT